MPKSITQTFRHASGTYYVRYVFPVKIRAKYPNLGRELRFSLRSKDRVKARHSALHKLLLIENALNLLSALSIENLLKLIVERSGSNKPEKISGRSESLGENLSNEAITKNEFYALMSVVEENSSNMESIDPNDITVFKPTDPQQNSDDIKEINLTEVDVSIHEVNASAGLNDNSCCDSKHKETKRATKKNSTDKQVTDLKKQETSTLTFGELVQRFFADNLAQHVFTEGDATYRKYTGYMRNVVEVVGEKTPIDTITPPMVMEYRNIILEYPARRFVGCNAKRKLMDLMSDPTIQRIKKDTATEYFDRFRAVLDHGCILGYLSSNPAASIKIRKVTGRSGTGGSVEVSRKPFTDKDLINILNGYIYHGNYNGGRRKLLDAHFWVPIIALYTGMRIGEICQLQVTDIHLEGITWHGRHFNEPYIQVCEEHRSQRVKNKNATRKVPIHRQLIQIGFLDYVTSRKESQSDSENAQLFDGMRYEEHSKWGRVISRWFNGDGLGKTYKGYKHHVIPEADLGGKVFHSFRHTFIDILRNTLGRGGKPIISAIVGHEEAGSTEAYGDGLQLDVLTDAINSVRYSDQVEELVSTLRYEDFIAKKRGKWTKSASKVDSCNVSRKNEFFTKNEK